MNSSFWPNLRQTFFLKILTLTLTAIRICTEKQRELSKEVRPLPWGGQGGGISGLTLLLLPIKIVLRQENVLHPQLEFPKARGPQGTIAHMRKHTARG